DFQDYRANRTMLSADGIGSLIAMSNAASFNGAAWGYYGYDFTVQAQNSGTVDLSKVTSIIGSPTSNAGYNTSNLQFLVQTSGNIKLNSLLSVTGRTTFNIQVPSYTLPALQTAYNTTFSIGNGNTLNATSLASF